MLLSKQLLTIISHIATVTIAAANSDTEAGTSIVSCNPLSATVCPPDPALATSITDNFDKPSEHYMPYRYPSGISYGDDGLSLTLAKRFDNPSLVSDFYMMFGKVEVWLKSAAGTGIISSFYLQSDDLDEIDLEWMGTRSQLQSNYFSKGDTSTYDRGEYHDMPDPRADFHNYTLDWNEDTLSWYIDGKLVRTLSKDSPSGYPQTPMRIYFGIWAGGDPSNAKGTIEWAGGLTDYSQAPFSMHIKSIVASDYSTGTEYSYDGTSGSWQSIKAKDGQINGRKAIAMAEFASLVQGNETSNDNNVSVDTSQVSSLGSTSSTATSFTLSSSIDATSLTTGTSEEDLISSTESTRSTTASTEHTEKTISLKSEFLTPSTLTSTTKTSSKHISSSSSVSHTITSNTENAAVLNAYSGFIAFIMFVLSIF